MNFRNCQLKVLLIFPSLFGFFVEGSPAFLKQFSTLENVQTELARPFVSQKQAVRARLVDVLFVSPERLARGSTEVTMEKIMKTD